MRVLVFGRTGQVARALARHDGVTCLDRAAADLGDPAACADVITNAAADVIINAAAFTAVDQAEAEAELATMVNGTAVAAMAAAAAKRRLPFLHLSTDYVFDGSGTRPWCPDDATAPLGVYGRSKLQGEAGARAAGGVYAILRTSWVFSAFGANFVKTMLRLGAGRDELSIVNDQTGGPTAAADIAAALMVMARMFHAGKALSGTYHFAGTPNVSWAAFAAEIFKQAGLSVTISGIPTTEYPTPAKRPLNSRLNCDQLGDIFAIPRPDWRTGLRQVLLDLKDIK